MKNSRIVAVTFAVALTLSGCMKSPSSTGDRNPASNEKSRNVWWFKNTKPTWKFNYDAKPPIRTADWVDYLQLPFNASAPNPFGGVDSNVTAIDYGLFNPQLGGGHIAKAAQHALTYGNYLVGRQCLEEAVKDYMVANNITSSPDKFFYEQGFWPMRASGIVAGDSQITKISKALKSLHGGDLVYSKIQSNGPENGAEVVTLNCTTCHESRALIPSCSAPGCANNGTFKAVRNPWGTEGYISKNLKLMGQAVQDAVSKAASGSACASGPEKHIMAALYEIQKAKHVSTSDSGQQQVVDMDPRRILALTPDSSFYNPSGALAHTVLNLLVNEDSWANKKPASVDQAYQMFRPEDVLTNNQFFPILNANFNNFFGINRNGSPGPVNFSLNAAWSQKYYSPTANMFHGMGCSFKRLSDGMPILIPCDITEKAIALAATTNSQAENPNLSNDTLSRFPGTTANYKWPLRKYSGSDGVFERTRKLFIGLESNTANPAIPDLVNGRAMTYESINRGMNLYNARCSNCHGSASNTYNSTTQVMELNPGLTDVTRIVAAHRDTPARAYIANLRKQPYVLDDAPRDLVMKQYEGYRGLISYGTLPDAKQIVIKNLVGIALEQRFGCYLSMNEFLSRSTPKAIQVTSSVLDVQNLGYVKQAKLDYTPGNEASVLAAYPRHNIFWHNEHPECGPLTSGGLTQPTEFYDQTFHGGILDGTGQAKLTASEIKDMTDFFVAISFDGSRVKKGGTTDITVRLIAPAKYTSGTFQANGMQALTPTGILNGNSCKESCAKFQESCDPMVENFRDKPNRTCCSDIDDSQGYWSRSTLRCQEPMSADYYGDYGADSAGTPMGKWIYCESDDECHLRGGYAYDNSYDSNGGIGMSCVNNRCVIPESSPYHPNNSGAGETNFFTGGATPPPAPGNEAGYPDGYDPSGDSSGYDPNAGGTDGGYSDPGYPTGYEYTDPYSGSSDPGGYSDPGYDSSGGSDPYYDYWYE